MSNFLKGFREVGLAAALSIGPGLSNSEAQKLPAANPDTVQSGDSKKDPFADFKAVLKAYLGFDHRGGIEYRGYLTPQIMPSATEMEFDRVVDAFLKREQAAGRLGDLNDPEVRKELLPRIVEELALEGVGETSA